MADIEVLRMVYEDAKVAEINAEKVLAAAENYRRAAEHKYHEALWQERMNALPEEE